MIVAEGVTKRFGGRSVLHEMDLSVPAGALTLLVGDNGSGKSTTLRIVTGLTRADSGRVLIAGVDLAKEPTKALSELVFLPQSPRFHPRLTVFQVLTFYARLRGRASRDVPAQIAQWGLDDHAQDATATLSGGLRQRLALAVFALGDAQTLILDEPGLSLDPFWRGRLQDFLVNAAHVGRTVLVASHLLGEWESKADRCVLLADGQIRAELPPDRLREVFGQWTGDAKKLALNFQP